MSKHPMTRVRWILVSVVAAAGLALVGWGEISARAGEEPGPAAAENRETDRTAIQELRTKLVAFLEKRNLKGLLECFTLEAEYVPAAGEPVQGTAELEKAFGAHFAQGEGERTIRTEGAELRFLSRDSAMERGRFLLKSEGAQDPAGSRYSALFVRDAGHWKVALLRERIDVTVSLESLEWLVGNWEVRTEGKTVTTAYEWALDKKFLRSQFSVTEDGKTRTGWQILTLDPSKESLRAWTFDSNGGFGEGHWRRDGDHWVVDSRITLADGGASRASNIVTRIDEDTFTWQATHRFLNDRPLDDLPPVRITRSAIASVTKEKESAK